MDQLVKNGMIDHELGCIILRRQNQVDRDSNPAIPYLNHWQILECDLSTLALSGTSISDFLEFQNQFAGQTVKHAIEACQLFYIPAIIRDRWALYIWDMLTRVIQVYDPTGSPRAYCILPARLICSVANPKG